MNTEIVGVSLIPFCFHNFVVSRIYYHNKVTPCRMLGAILKVGSASMGAPTYIRTVIQ